MRVGPVGPNDGFAAMAQATHDRQEDVDDLVRVVAAHGDRAHAVREIWSSTRNSSPSAIATKTSWSTRFPLSRMSPRGLS